MNYSWKGGGWTSWQGWGWGWTSWKVGGCGRTSWEGVGWGLTIAGKDEDADKLVEDKDELAEENEDKNEPAGEDKDELAEESDRHLLLYVSSLQHLGELLEGDQVVLV